MGYGRTREELCERATIFVVEAARGDLILTSVLSNLHRLVALAEGGKLKARRYPSPKKTP